MAAEVLRICLEGAALMAGVLVAGFVIEWFLERWGEK